MSAWKRHQGGTDIVPELIVLGFNEMDKADTVIPELQALQREGLLDLADWARVIRRPDGKIEVRQATSTTGAGAAGGALWGMLFGLLFLMPLAGLAIGGITGAIMGKLADYGIDDKFIKEVGNQITPGSSALFLYVVRATTDRVIERLQPFTPNLIRTSLSSDAEERLREALGPAETPASA
jgi:uncharacterized membrane protein